MKGAPRSRQAATRSTKPGRTRAVSAAKRRTSASLAKTLVKMPAITPRVSSSPRAKAACWWSQLAGPPKWRETSSPRSLIRAVPSKSQITPMAERVMGGAL